jgi:hypothetical protein
VLAGTGDGRAPARAFDLTFTLDRVDGEDVTLRTSP